MRREIQYLAKSIADEPFNSKTSESIQFFQHVSIVDFLTDTQWTPLFDDAHFGIMVLISGTLVSSGVALLVAIPMGTVIAIYLSEFANQHVREIAKPVLDQIFARLEAMSKV